MKKRLATICLIIGMWLNPLGFDVAQVIMIKLTGSLYMANLGLYCLALFFFVLYFLFSGNNPAKDLKTYFKNLKFIKRHESN